jgi:hypothetical protein
VAKGGGCRATFFNYQRKLGDGAGSDRKRERRSPSA